MKRKNPDILILVDTRLAREVENQVRAEWGGFAYFSSFTSQARGVSILIKKDLPIKILDEFEDRTGNIAAVLVSIEERKILIEGV